MKVMLIEESMPTTSMLQKTLIEEGYDVLVIADYQGDIFKKASDINPDIIIVNVEAADEAMLTQLKYINDAYPKPVVIFSENGDDKIINSAVQAGLSLQTSLLRSSLHNPCASADPRSTGSAICRLQRQAHFVLPVHSSAAEFSDSGSG